MKSTRGVMLSLSMGFLWLTLGYMACAKVENRSPATADQSSIEQSLQEQLVGAEDGQLSVFLTRILEEAEIPQELTRHIQGLAAEGPAFLLDLLAVLEGDPYLRALVDKGHALPAGYEPDDLVELTNGSYQVSRRGLLLRRPAAMALEEMAVAAQNDGVSLIASSAYRSYSYQETVYARNVRESGQETADRESARPGQSQHQLGLVVDFGSIDDSFAQTRAGRWIVANAHLWGWSISFPQGYEAITGYRWESWHYRYVGRELTYFIDTYFNGIQQYALQFLYHWEKAGGF
ncbi:MAG: M15 family metallopeptidase [Treponema sp.]|jgi:D-alanyl-D-alanine carboxypeptidase|nr:M15 family metallopeptidase [Treponema sp.]